MYVGNLLEVCCDTKVCARIPSIAPRLAPSSGCTPSPDRQYQHINSLIMEPMGQQKTDIIIGAGPAGLTAAYELLTRTDIKPVVIEMSDHLGGISRTVNYKGNRIDIGGHRFFSKSDRVMNWWFQHLPMESAGPQVRIAYQG